MNYTFWQRWLLVGSLVVVVIGLGIALLNQTPLFMVFSRQVNPTFWDSLDAPANVTTFLNWVYTLMGAVMAGWGINLVFLAAYPFRQRESWAWISIAVSMTVWYIIDTTVSLAVGFVFNAVFNTLLLVLVAGVPLAFTYRSVMSNKANI
ncbi:MAG TPA: hypothetical protein VHO69_01500 [Phototrophicaceae bacterium]|nr:hypothetical protein [Phototrophicaceae bacterium]